MSQQNTRVMKRVRPAERQDRQISPVVREFNGDARRCRIGLERRLVGRR